MRWARRGAWVQRHALGGRCRVFLTRRVESGFAIALPEVVRSLLLAPFLLLGCRSHTLPIGRIPAYAANQPVITQEGNALSLADGGSLRLIPHDEDSCLVETERPATAPGVRSVALVAAMLPCRNVVVPNVQRVEAGPLLRVYGSRGAVEVDPQLVESVRVAGPSQEPTAFAPRMGVQSSGMIAGGSVLLAAGVAGAIACFTAATSFDSVDDHFGLYRSLVGFAGASSLAAGIGGGVPLIVIGARQMRLPQAEQPAVQGFALGSGIGLHWQLQ